MQCDLARPPFSLAPINCDLPVTAGAWCEYLTVTQPVYSYFKSGAPRNASWVTDAQLDGILEAQRRALDEKERKRLIREVEFYLEDQQYRLELPESLVTLVMQPEVRNVWYKTSGWVDAEFYRFAWLAR